MSEMKRVRKPKDQYRVVITAEANRLLEEMVTRINQDFKSGSVTKSDVANYVFSNISSYLSESDFNTIKSLHFDEKKVLGSILKNAADLPDELRQAIRSHYGIVETEKRRRSRVKRQAPSTPLASTVEPVNRS